MTEKQLHLAICEYIKWQYPSIIFTSEPSGVRVTPGIARELARMRSGKGLPDLWILEPNKEYKALTIELKAVSPYRKDGTLKKSEHLESQSQVLALLREKGYYAEFCTGFDETVETINKYMNNRIT